MAAKKLQTMDRSGVAKDAPENFLTISRRSRDAMLSAFSALSSNTSFQEEVRACVASNRLVVDWRHYEMFSFLQLSPSYEVARQIVCGERSAADGPTPADMDRVLQVFDRLGDVNGMVFADWWANRLVPALVAQGTPIDTRPRSRSNGKSDNPAATAVSDSLTTMPDRLLDLRASRVQERVVKQAHRLISAQVTAPHKRLFELGKRARIAPIYDTDEHAARKDVSGREVVDIMTSQRLLRAYRLAEHAARGRFPCLDPLDDDPGRPRFNAEILRASSARHAAALGERVQQFWSNLRPRIE
jgi:hypothetical protein